MKGWWKLFLPHWFDSLDFRIPLQSPRMKIKSLLPSLAGLLAAVIFPTHFARAQAAGSLDTSFNPNTNGIVNAIAIQGDGKILIGGSFTTVDGLARTNVARLNADGTLDPDFAPSADAAVTALALRSDGLVLIAGSFDTVNGVARKHVARLAANGTLDTSFVPALDDFTVTSVVSTDNNQVVVGGWHTVTFGPPFGGGANIANVVRLDADGSADADNNNFNALPSRIDRIVTASDGKLLLGTEFLHGFSPVYRINADGSMDRAFTPADSGVLIGSGLALQNDGKIVVGGSTNFDEDGPSLLVRFNGTDGSIDPDFRAVDLGTNGVAAVAVQPDGRIIAAGSFTEANGFARMHLARVNADGAIDASFVPPGDADEGVSALALQSDGKIVIGGTFTTLGGTAHVGIARLNGSSAGSPQITVTSAVAARVGTPFSYQITATNNPTSFAAGSVYSRTSALSKPLPDGLSLDAATGIISGTPTREGDYVLAIGATNAAGADVKQIPLTVATSAGFAHPVFFTGEEPLSDGVYFLRFFYLGDPNGFFSYYSYLTDPHYIFHFDLGYEYVFDAADASGGVYFYDFASNGFFYSSPKFPFPYLYDFNLDSVVYYYGNPDDPERYNTNGVRYFYVFSTGQTISK